MARSDTLHSDHINYLIFRYLQEAGHETTAVAFHRDWHRPREFSEPENFPFASTVGRYELVRVIQDGLSYDELQSRYPQNERKFRFTVAGNAGLSRASVEEDERENGNGTEGSRPPSSGKRKGAMRGPAMRAPDEFPTPAPKRQRVSHGEDGSHVHVNGDRDAMDVDAEGASVDEDADADGEPASPTLASEDAIDVPAERYDSMDVATQTEVRTGPKTHTLTFGISKPGASIYKSCFNPSAEDGKLGSLLAVGEGLCRYYRIPDQVDGDLKQIDHTDEPSLPINAAVTSLSWHPNGHTASCAVDSTRGLTSDKSASMQFLMDIGQDIGTVMYPSGPPLLDPPGIVLSMQHSPSGKYLLVARSNVKRGVVQIWETSPNDAENAHARDEPCAWVILEHPVLDAAWTSDTEFVIGGEQGLSSSYTINQPPKISTIDGFTVDTITPHNLTQQIASIVPGSTKWEKVRYEPVLKITVFASSAEQKLVVVPQHVKSDSMALPPRVAIDTPPGLATLEFRPSKAEIDPPIVVLAAAFADGTVVLYSVSASSCEELCTLDLSADAALALGWSPDGKHLAAGGSDIVRIWRIDPENMDTQPLVTWRPEHESNGSMNGNGEANGAEADVGELAQSEPSLSWSADGERLGFAVDRQIAVISFRPPLTGNGAVAVENGRDTQMNGGASP